jgi:iron complex transport system permease protein
MTAPGWRAPSGVPDAAAASGTADLAVARVFRLPASSLAASLTMLAIAVAIGVMVGPAGLDPKSIVLELLDRIPGVAIDSGMTETQKVILVQWRLSRVVLGAGVGASLAMAGAGYQGVFRNPLADPFLLGAAAGAGLGATLVFAMDLVVGWGPFDSVAVAAFAGSLVGVGLSAALGRSADRSPAGLLLAGVAVASFLTALQTFVLQRQSDVIRDVYAWIFGRLTTAGWSEPALLMPYLVVCGGVLVMHRRHLDVLRLGDDEARSLGIDPKRVRIIVVVAASLLTAVAVAVSGLIAFIGVVIPHVVRLLFGSSYRVVVPLSAIVGAAFLVLADVGARTLLSPAELPIGVLTSFIGAPFFALVLRSQRRISL